MPRTVLPTPQEAAAAAADALLAALEGKDKATLALSGGSGGELTLEALSRRRSQLDWSKVDFFWADERRVPLDHPRSNYGLARRLLLDPLGIAESRRHPLVDPAKAERELLALAPDGLLAVQLGLGDDGHTASLFPGSPALTSSAWVAETTSPSGEPRLTLTPAYLKRAVFIAIVATGAGKKDVVEKASTDPSAGLPIQALGPRASWFLDDAAASN